MSHATPVTCLTRMHRASWVALVICACSSNPGVPDGGPLPEADAGADAGLVFDAGSTADAGRDAGVDAGFDAGVDAGADAGPEVDAGRPPVVCMGACDPTGTYSLTVNVTSCLVRTHQLTITRSTTIDGGLDVTSTVPGALCGVGTFSAVSDGTCTLRVSGGLSCSSPATFNEVNGFEYSAEFSACGTDAVIRFKRFYCEGDPNGSWRTYQATLRRMP